jgi:hypothetical protein
VSQQLRDVIKSSEARHTGELGEHRPAEEQPPEPERKRPLAG